MPKYPDDLYAAGLNQRHRDATMAGRPALPPGTRDKDIVEREGESIEVPTGTLLATMRSKGRKKAPTPELTEALGLFYLKPYQSEDKLWRLPTVRDVWTDAVYAAALNQRYETAQRYRQVPVLPGKHGTERMILDGTEVDVPIGPLISKLKNGGRKAAPSPDLVAALLRYGKVPSGDRDAEGRWRLISSSEVAGVASAALNPVGSMSALSAMPMTAPVAAPASAPDSMFSLSGVSGYGPSSGMQPFDPMPFDPTMPFDPELQSALMEQFGDTEFDPGLPGDMQQPGGMQPFDPMPFDPTMPLDPVLQSALMEQFGDTEFDPVQPGDMQQPGDVQRRDYTKSAFAAAGYRPPSGDMPQSAYGQQPGGMQPSAYPYPPPYASQALGTLPPEPEGDHQGQRQGPAGSYRPAPEQHQQQPPSKKSRR
ncbi:hypothetical protein ABT030_51945 [Streptomyces mirabilis]|uniref:hypothetical protein n=1 Tax=Streptomyces mirabilis TaxID=68239 RepID=UPI003324D881